MRGMVIVGDGCNGRAPPVGDAGLKVVAFEQRSNVGVCNSLPSHK
jgi:hypothetical protein